MPPGALRCADESGSEAEKAAMADEGKRVDGEGLRRPILWQLWISKATGAEASAFFGGLLARESGM